MTNININLVYCYQVRYKSVWGTICDDNFGEAEAIVACRQLCLFASLQKYYKLVIEISYVIFPLLKHPYLQMGSN